MVTKKKAKSSKKSKKVSGDENERDLVVAEEGQVYGQVTAMLGNCRMMVTCSDGPTRLGVVCGWLRRRKIFVKLGDRVLVSLRQCMTLDNKADVVYAYTSKEISKLVLLGAIKEAETDGFMDTSVDQEGCDFDFDRI